MDHIFTIEWEEKSVLYVGQPFALRLLVTCRSIRWEILSLPRNGHSVMLQTSHWKEARINEGLAIELRITLILHINTTQQGRTLLHLAVCDIKHISSKTLIFSYDRKRQSNIQPDWNIWQTHSQQGSCSAKNKMNQRASQETSSWGECVASFHWAWLTHRKSAQELDLWGLACQLPRVWPQLLVSGEKVTYARAGGKINQEHNNAKQIF